MWPPITPVSRCRAAIRYSRSPRPLRAASMSRSRAKIEHLVLEGEVTHRGVVDRRGHLDELLQHLVRHRRYESLQHVVGGRLGGLCVQPIDRLVIDLGEDLLASRVVAGVVEAMGLQERARSEIVLGAAQPDRGATRLLGAGGRARRPVRCRGRADDDRGGRRCCPRRDGGCRGSGSWTSKTATGSSAALGEIEIALVGLEVPAELQPAGGELGKCRGERRDRRCAGRRSGGRPRR